MSAIDPSQKQAARREAEAQSTPLMRLDQWMHEHPWHPRVLPFVVWVAMLYLIIPARAMHPLTYPILVAAQMAMVSWMLWRYRGLMPEINWRFHWSAIVGGVGGVAAWVALGQGMIALFPGWFDDPGTDVYREMGPALGAVSLSMHLAAMAIVVPMFEEVFIRSALMRSMVNWRPTLASAIDLLHDLPIIGPMISESSMVHWAEQYPRPMRREFEAHHVGELSVFNVLFVGLLWCVVSHARRDWPGTIACAVMWAWVLWLTNRKGRRYGLGPAIWSHAITNALLWAYAILWGQWQFL
ncbi:MAG: hypothetical protein GC162_03895 [Planctomycetes bacterium]|nr:hypothetical protein [Planctomycetota bacterium]